MPIPPPKPPGAGALAASTWGAVAGELAHAGRVIAYDRRGYSRSPGQPVHSISQHTADAAALLDALHIHSAVVAGTSVGATIAIDLALRRPDLVHTVIAYESPWRASRRRPTTASLAALAGTGWLALRGHHADAAEYFLRWAYTYRDGGTAWDAFPEPWQRIARGNAKAVLADIRIAIGSYPPPDKLAAITTPVICAHGTRSNPTMAIIARSLANAIPAASLRPIEGAGHAVAFDAPATFVKVITEAIPSQLAPTLSALPTASATLLTLLAGLLALRLPQDVCPCRSRHDREAEAKGPEFPAHR